MSILGDEILRGENSVRCFKGRLWLRGLES
jgi:hypothetical protein